jgi:uncharacterized damage-inducible protein DinB
MSAENPLRDLLAATFAHVANRIVERVDDLTDDEYFWEPVAGCWSLRQGPDGWSADWDAAPPHPPPVTTIAWRLAHLCYCLQEHGLRPVAFERGAADWHVPTILPGSAAAGVQALKDAVAAWNRDLDAVDDTRLWELMGPEAGYYATSSVAAFVEHIHDEAIHHGAEIGVLRDLYAAGLRT